MSHRKRAVRSFSAWRFGSIREGGEQGSMGRGKSWGYGGLVDGGVFSEGSFGV